ncbi:MAG TPA: hypothetical protein V6D17_08665 [Candidatus Obscuribacterales bacterium]
MQSLKKAGEDPAVELFILSFISLYLELLVIRWMAADIQAFAIFKTFPLVACFVGLGVGCALGSQKQFRLLPAALLFFTLIMMAGDVAGHLMHFPTLSGFIWGKPGQTDILPIYTAVFMPLLLVLLSGPFLLMASLGARLGALFNAIKPLTAYSINVAGAIAGSITFSVVCFQGLAPWQLLILPLVLLLPYLSKETGKARWGLVLVPLCVALAALSHPVLPDINVLYAKDKEREKQLQAPPVEVSTYWSPYQRLDVVPRYYVDDNDGKPISALLGNTIFSNRLQYQEASDVSPSRFAKYNSKPLSDYVMVYGQRYVLPYQFQPPGEVLVVGAGSGTDVKQALEHGARHVDAVDIDPVIMRIGKESNPGQPYQDSRVTLICDDARHYFNHCQKKYDLIVFSHLDSVATVGTGSVRLDNYVYTRESMKSALRLLKPDGLMVISFCTTKDWFRDRLYNTLKEACGYSPVVINDKHASWYVANTFFIAGRDGNINNLTIPPAYEHAFEKVAAYTPKSDKVLTDDWPFIYVVTHTVDVFYLLVVLEVIALSLFASRRVLFSEKDPRNWQLFFMGAAFLLLELQSISRLSLIYGSSWLTSAVVINAILVMILFANFVVGIGGEAIRKNKNALYIFLMATLIVSYFFPINQVIAHGGGAFSAATLVVPLVISLPMFAAGMIFASSFSESANPRRALALNLLGTVLGALLEYFSNYLGIKNLLLIAVGLYLVSWICLLRAAKLQTAAGASAESTDLAPETAQSPADTPRPSPDPTAG